MSGEKIPEEMQEIIEDFLTETREGLSDLERVFVDLENHPGDLELLNRVFRTVHSLKGAADFLGFSRMVAVAHKTESLLNQLRKGVMTLTPELMDVIFEAVDLIKVLLQEIESGKEEGVGIEGTIAKLTGVLGGDPEQSTGAPPTEDAGKTGRPADRSKGSGPKSPKRAGGAKSEKPNEKTGQAEQVELPTEEDKAQPFSQPVSRNASSVPAETDGPDPAASPSSEFKEASEGSVEQTIRVDVARLDSVMNLVGELVLARNRLFQINQSLETRYGDDDQIQCLLDTTLHLSLLTTDLQLAVLKARMQPMRKVFAKIPRIVRDLARKKKKLVDLQIVGEDTEVDKSIIEEIGDPLVHLIRNAVDHGIEIPDFRDPLGKPEKGLLRVAAAYEGDHITLDIEDDGKGMDPEKLRRAAVEKGILDPSEAERLNHRECLNLIFAPGLSTAEKVTSTSGRGVGMDVVKTNISKLNGTISVESKVGEGSRIRIRVPLTVAIIQALLVGVGDEVFALPLSSVIETLCIGEDDIQTVDDKEVISLRDEILPVMRLSEELDTPFSEGIPEERRYVVVAGVAESKIGLMVTRLYGQEEIVIKPLGHYLRNRQEFAGATLTGDGKVIMILDIGGLIGRRILV